MDEKVPPRKDRPRKDVLVVDDEPSIQKLIAAILDEMQLSYDIAGSGKEAYRLAMSTQYHVITMDIKMQDWDGLYAIRSMEFCDEFQKVIVISGYLEDKRNDLEMEPMVVGLLEKPFEPERLRETIRTALESEPLDIDPRERPQK